MVAWEAGHGRRQGAGTQNSQRLLLGENRETFLHASVVIAHRRGTRRFNSSVQFCTTWIVCEPRGATGLIMRKRLPSGVTSWARVTGVLVYASVFRIAVG